MRTEDTHVLVLAMSDLSNFVVNYYQFKPEDGPASELIEGIGQLEVIPQFIKKYYKEKITHIIILETKFTKDRLEEKYIKALKEANSAAKTPMIRFSEQAEETKFYDKVSAVSFFKKRMEMLGITPEFIDIDIDEDKPEQGFKDLLNKIRTLYRECEEREGDWKLWLDSHGGFRDISLALDTLLQVLSTTDMSGYPKLQDGQKIIGVDGVYSVKFHRNSSESDPCQIIDRTDFYSQFTTPALKAYMNYGQYLQSALRPWEGDHEYAFISYKHDEAEKERIAFLSLLKKGGFLYWYDDGIHINSDWQETLEKWKCSEKNVLFIALVTKGYYGSYQCLKELQDAMKLGKKIILVSLDNTPLYLNKSLFAEQDEKKLKIPCESLNSLSRTQHINLKCYLINDVLQEGWLLEKLHDAAGNEFAMIHEGYSGVKYDGRKEYVPDCFVNFSNHPSNLWSEKQREAALAFGTIVDIPFPNVDPAMDEETINDLAQSQINLILSCQPKAVMCQGEFTLCNTIVRQLQMAGIDVYAACSERHVQEHLDEHGNSVRKTFFSFVQFRKYPKI